MGCSLLYLHTSAPTLSAPIKDNKSDHTERADNDYEAPLSLLSTALTPASFPFRLSAEEARSEERRVGKECPV